MCLILQIELIWTSVTELYIIIPYNIQTDNKSNSQYSTYIIHDIFFFLLILCYYYFFANCSFGIGQEAKIHLAIG